jgi:beta-mannosidase
MLGLDPALARDHPLPDLVAAAETGVPYVPSAPCGGDPPFRPDTGVAHYFGVGGYRRPLSDVRASHVRFAAECLAIANVPDSGDLGGVPRDEGAGWDFADVRDHYLRDLYGVDPEALRASDFEHYLDLSRAVSGDVMSEVFGDWRRGDSGCGGGLVLWLRDLARGSGWGLLDVDGVPKVAYHHLRRLLAPVAVWTTDEGLSGIDVHVANDRPEPLRATLRVALYRDREVRVDVATEDLDVPPHTTIRRGAEQVLGHFADVSYAYRFGPPGHDLVVASLERDGAAISQAVRHLLGRSAEREPNDRLGLNASAHPVERGMLVRVTCTRFVDGVRLRVPGWEADDDAFPVEPGGARDVLLRGEGEWPGGTVRALNLLGEVAIS